MDRIDLSSLSNKEIALKIKIKRLDNNQIADFTALPIDIISFL